MQVFARYFRWAAVATVAGYAAGLGVGAAISDNISFNRDIRPILASKCFGCHGATAKTHLTKLRLSSREEATKDIGGRSAVVAGQPDKSELIRRILSPDPDTVMPPPGEGRPLSSREKALLKGWIEQGGKWETHWAFIPPKHSPMPAVTNASWPFNPIDYFILARLEAEGIVPSPDTDRRTLLRRVSFDLTGLPPTAAEVDAFMSDSDSHAYAKQVVRLIQSPQFGERMAVLWLDLVRYADSDGYHADNARSIWPYRDYVVNSFNGNTPFDDFTRHQLAGDLLPNATPDTQIASGYNMLIETTEENGANEKEYRAKYAADRVRTTAAVWLGLTLGCAECHDHKSDPLTQRDFYRFAAFFADLVEPGVGKRETTRLASVEQNAELEVATKEADAAVDRLTALTESLIPQRNAWVRQMQLAYGAGRLGWKPVRYEGFSARDKRRFEPRADGSVFVRGPELPDDYSVEISTPLEEVRSLRLEVLRDPEVAQDLQRRGIPFSYALSEVEVEIHAPAQAPRRISISSGFAEIDAVGHRIEQAFDGDPNTYWAVGDRIKSPVVRATFQFGETVVMGLGTRLVVRLRNSLPATAELGNIRHFRVALARQECWDPGEHGMVSQMVTALSRTESARTEADQSALTQAFFYSRAEVRQANGVAKRLIDRTKELANAIPSTIISRAGPPRVTRILPRGNWMDGSGPVVQPALPAEFHNVQESTNRLTRLDLANWLVSRDNPLTARVFVNRLWKQFFGTGLVTTLADFGVTGDSPSHPELLDQLAIEFVSSHWNVKHLVILMVMSHTYQQASSDRTDLKARDPLNRLLARQGRWRLDAEMIRDNALFSAGILVTNIGGPPNFPYQPAGYLDHLDFPQRGYGASSDLNQFRRGLYAFWQRTFLHPALMLFDAPPREECVAERPVSNSPLQALALLNNPTHVEAARHMAISALRSGGASALERAGWIFRQTLGRPPDAGESAALVGLYERQRERLRGRSEDARALNNVGLMRIPDEMAHEDVAAWTAVTRAVLNLHETITRY